MDIQIELNLLITLITVFLIPIVGAVVKMFIQMREHNIKIKEIDSLLSELKTFERRIATLEKDTGNAEIKIDECYKGLERIRDYVLKLRDSINGFKKPS